MCQQVQEVLNKSKIGIPEERLAFFRKVINPNSIPVQGWRGIIESITPVESGVVVDLRIRAYQPGLVDSLYLMERYSIVDGQVHYLGAIIPKQKPRFQIGL